ncbi:protein of unknown function (plasmid) [Cupriavidus taiwanensis]|uniref:Uncharacterized protein n=1 Tax=Cupriavidus taiwanensis TaxID=164546 RepID=A0A375HFV5_9BURK|nr:protein of unknown function [Cupriavidus taiwanensis]SOZ72445.1 protein of unknown function [Cupriavidus taiwanensis]SOZ74845.1 protein of unknown function [Cupriavidus taiwanensis]SPA03648.1 protein of unknown function [Cupriavidus taiwanensis]SPA11545.1 protein of unknown function [Cupriavidus taiwanensis]
MPGLLGEYGLHFRAGRLAFRAEIFASAGP